jgi:hypothetical protein
MQQIMAELQELSDMIRGQHNLLTEPLDPQTRAGVQRKYNETCQRYTQVLAQAKRVGAL